MREAGVNLVSLPVFSWPQLEPQPGVYDWGWLDRVIDVLWDAGIRIDLATATATPPSWLIRSHPEMLPWNEDGQRLEFGSRQAYCPSSPVWREHVARMARAMAERYGDHPALALWHVSNEYGDHVSRCWCPESSAHFRRWLEARYGDLDGLNDAWGVNVWGQRYTAWEHIEAPRRATGPVNPDAAARLRALLLRRAARALPARGRRAARGHPRRRRHDQLHEPPSRPRLLGLRRRRGPRDRRRLPRPRRSRRARAAPRSTTG